jgi:hypothetical protein
MLALEAHYECYTAIQICMRYATNWLFTNFFPTFLLWIQRTGIALLGRIVAKVTLSVLEYLAKYAEEKNQSEPARQYCESIVAFSC